MPSGPSLVLLLLGLLQGALACNCTDTCATAGNGLCEDGGVGSYDSTCSLGNDCSDCGPSWRFYYAPGTTCESAVFMPDTSSSVPCVNGVVYEGTCFCSDQTYAGAACDEVYEPPCSVACSTGAEDCCAYISAPLFVASQTVDRVVEFSAEAHEYVRFAEQEEVDSSSCLAFLSDGTLLTSSTSSVYAWDSQTGDLLGEIIWGYSYIYAMRVDNATDTIYISDADYVLAYQPDATNVSAPAEYLGVHMLCQSALFISDMAFGANGPDDMLILAWDNDWSSNDGTDQFVFRRNSSDPWGGPVRIRQVESFYDAPDLESWADGSFVLTQRPVISGESSIITWLAPNGALLTSVDHDGDPYDLRRHGDFIFVGDYTGFYQPWGLTQNFADLGQLGSSPGMLSSAGKMAVYNGAYSVTSGLATTVPTTVRTGTNVTVGIVLRDADGQRFSGASLLNVQVTGKMYLAGTSFVSSFTFDADVADLGDGDYLASFVPTRTSLMFPSVWNESTWVSAGLLSSHDDPEDYAYEISISLTTLEFQLPASPLPMWVQPGLPSAAMSTVTAATTHTATAGETHTIDVETMDEYGNLLLEGGYGDLLEVYGADGEALDASVDDPNTGTYVVSYVGTEAGEKILTILINGSEIATSPFVLSVYAGALNGSMCEVTGTGLAEVSVDATNDIIVAPMDEFGNRITAALNVSQFSVSVAPASASSQLLPYDTSVDAQNRLLISYVPEDAVDVVLSISYDGQTVGSSPYTIPILQRKEAYEINAGIRYSMVVLAIISMLITLGYGYLVHRWRSNNVIKFSQRRFCNLILLGGFFSLSVMILMCVAPSDVVCVLRAYVGNVSYAAMFSALFVKLWRVSKIANNTLLKKVDIKDKDLLKIMGCATGATFLYVTLWTIVAPLKVASKETSQVEVAASGMVTTYTFDVCESSQPAFSAVLVGLEALSLAVGVYLAFLTRNVSDTFAETRWIAISIYNMTFIGMLSLPLVYLLDVQTSDPNVFLLVVCVVVFATAGGTLHLVFVPKFMKIVQGVVVSVDDFSSHSSANANRGSAMPKAVRPSQLKSPPPAAEDSGRPSMQLT